MVNPNHSTCWQAKLHFGQDMANFFVSKSSSTVSSAAYLLHFFLFLTIKMSRNANVFLQLDSVRSTAFWSSAGMSVSP